MCWFDNWGNFYNWNNWSNAQVTPTANPDNQVTDGAAFDPTLDVAAAISGQATGQFYSVTFTVTTPEAGDSFFLDLTNTGFTQVGDKIFYGAIELATVSGGEDGSPFVITPAATSTNGHYYRAGLIGELVDAVRFSNGGAAESGSETITITSSTSSGTTVVNVPMTYVAGVSSPGVGFDLTGGLATAGPEQVLDHPGLSAVRSSITALADGGYVLVWQSSGGANGYDVHGQRYDASGQAVGDPFTVNSYVTSDQQLPQVSALTDGGFVVVWQSNGQDGASYGVYGQRYGADGQPDGAEFRANTTTDQSEGNQTVVGLADGGFVVLWETWDGSGDYVTRGQWYDADGVAQGGETTLVTINQPAGIQQATALADGGMAMLSLVYTGSQYELRLYIFDAVGAAVGSPTLVDTGYLGDGARDITALDGGGFVVSWFEGDEIRVQRFDDSGAATGEEITLAGVQNLNSVSITDLAGGGFVVSWQAYVDSRWQMFAQAFGADGQADGGVVSVTPASNTNTYPGRQSIDQLADGTIVVTWTWGGDVYTRELDFSEPALQTTEDGHGIPITLTGWDSDGSETLTVTLSGMPAGATFNQGEAGPDETWVIEVTDPDQLQSLQMTGPTHYTGAFTLTVSVVSVESADSSTSSSTHEVEVVVSVNASTPTIDIDREGGAFSNPGEVDAYDGAGAQAGSAAHPDGGFVVVNFQAGTNAVQVHRFGADGEPIGGPVTVDASAAAKSAMSIAVGADGAYFVVWSANDASGQGVYAVVVDSDGVPGPAFAVNSDATNNQREPVVVATSEGGFLVVWSDPASGSYNIRGQLYDAAGQPQGGNFAIGTDVSTNPSGNSTALRPVTTVLDDGRILVAWQEASSQGYYEIRGQVLAADGTPQGQEITFQPTTTTVHLEFPEVVGLADGGWVLSWSESNQVHAQRYDAAGDPVGPEFVHTTNLTTGSPITALPDGGYVLQWYASDDTLYAQRFDFQGEAVGGVLTVGRGGPGYASAAVVIDGDTLAFVYNFGGTGQVKTFDFAAYGLTGHEDGPIAIPIELTWPDMDGSETLTVTLSGFPEGAAFNQGAAGPDGTWVIEVADPADLANLTMALGPTATAGSFTLAISATTVESADGSTSTTEFVTDVTVEAGASDIDLAVQGGTPFTDAVGGPTHSPGADSNVFGLADGGWVVLYTTANDCRVQRFDADGQSVHDTGILGFGPPFAPAPGQILQLADGGLVAFLPFTVSGSYALYIVPMSVDGVADVSAIETPLTYGTAFDVVPFGDGFLLAWEGVDGAYTIQAYDAANNPIGSPTTLANGIGVTADGVHIAVAGDGQSGLALVTGSASGTPVTAVYGLDSDGAAGPQVVAHFNLMAADLAALADGSYAMLVGVGAPPMSGLIHWLDAAGNTIDTTTLPDATSIEGMALSPLEDGGVLAFWLNSAGDSVVQRFGADHAPIGDPVVVDNDGIPESASLLPDGTVVISWTDAGGVHTQEIAFTDGAVTALEGEAIATPIALTWPDQDGSETLTVTLSGFPAGATFSQGAAGPDDTWVIEVADPADLLTLTMTAPGDFAGEFLLDVAATATESANGDTANDALSIQVTVTAEASQPELTIDGEPVAEAAGTPHLTASGQQYVSGIVEFGNGDYGVFHESGEHIYLQRYDADGVPVGTPSQVTSNAGYLYGVTQAALAGGGYAIAYSYANGGINSWVETFDADGVRVSGPTAVPGAYYGTSLSLSALPDGGAMLTWMDSSTPVRRYMAQEVDASGALVGSPMLLPAPESGWGTGEVIGVTLADGSVAVGFTFTADGQAFTAMLTGVDADGQPFSAAIALGSGHLASLTALEGGGLAYIIGANLYLLDGDLQPVGDPIALTNGFAPEVHALSDGGFVVVGTQGDAWVAQRYDADGSPLGDPFAGTGFGYNFELLELADGSLVVSWEDGAGRSTQVINYATLLNGAEDAAIAVALDLTWPDQDGSETMTVTLSGFPEGATFSQGEAGDGGTWTIEVTDPADLLDLTMTPPTDWSGSFDLTVTATTEESANGDTASDSQTVTVEVAAINDAPEVTAPASISVTEDTGTAVTGITVADVDSPSLTVTLSVASGQLYAVSAMDVFVGGSEQALTLTGTAADINAFIAASMVTFWPAANSEADVTLGVSASDNALSGVAEVNLDLQPVNDAPQITGLVSAIGVTEDTATAVTGIVVADVDSASLTVTLAVASGSLSATSGDGVTVGGTASALTLTGSAADINAFIAASGVMFTPAANATADVNLEVTVSDGALEDSGSIDLDVTAVNDAPEITAPASISGTEDTATPVTGLSVADVDNASLTVTLTVASGALSATSGGGVTVGGDASALTLTGSASDINAFIAASEVMFTPVADSEADVTLGVSVTDGALSDQQDVTIDVQPVNDAPFITAAATGEVLENNASVLTGVTVGDIDSAGLTLTLTASSGTLAAASGSGVTVSGSGTGVLELSGSSADLNAFIAGGAVSFLTVEDSEGDVTITASVSDGELEASADTVLTVLPDSIDGGPGDDPLEGTDDGDTLRGFGGDDAIDGGAGDDVIEGGEGDDTLIGGAGNDLLLGGNGADTFRFEAGLFGADTITDFANGVDLIQLTGIAGVDDFSDLVVTANGGNALITLPDGSTITLNGVSDGLVDASDFVFGG